MTIPGMNPAKRRYVIRFLSTMGVYVIAVLAGGSYLVRSHPTSYTFSPFSPRYPS